MSRNLFKRMGLSFFFLSALIVISGCWIDDGEDVNIGVRFIHVSPSDSLYDIEIEERDIVHDFSYAKNTGYYEMGDDRVDFTFRRRDGEANRKFTFEKIFFEDENYTLFLMDDNNDSVLCVENSKEVSYGKAKIRFIHAVKDVDVMGVTLRNQVEEIPGSIFYKSDSFYEDNLEPGNYSISFVDKMKASNEIARLDNILLDGNQIYTAIIYGTVYNGDAYPITVKIFKDTEDGSTEANAYLQIIHASPDAGPVDIYQKEYILMKGLKFKGSIPYIPILDGKYAFKVVSTTSGTKEILLNEKHFFEGGKTFSMALINRSDQMNLLTLEDDLSRPEDGKSHVRFIHAISDAAMMNIEDQASSSPAFSIKHLSFGQSSHHGHFLPLATKAYRFKVCLSNTTNALIENQHLDLTNIAIKHRTVVISGFSDHHTTPGPLAFLVEHP